MIKLEQQYRTILDKFLHMNLSEQKINNIIKYCVHHTILESSNYYNTIPFKTETTLPLAIKILTQINTDDFEILSDSKNVETCNFKYIVSDYYLDNIENEFNNDITNQIVSLINNELKNDKKLFIWNLVSEIKSFYPQTKEIVAFTNFYLQ